MLGKPGEKCADMDGGDERWVTPDDAIELPGKNRTVGVEAGKSHDGAGPDGTAGVDF